MRYLRLILVTVLLVGCGDGASTGTSGVRGQVWAGPQCPVVQAGSPCPDRPFIGTVIASDDDGEVARTTTDATGRYELALEPGTYSLVAGTATGAQPPTGAPVDVTVTPGRYGDVTLTVDTGIR